MNIEALSSYKSRNPLTARWLFHMIVINIWLWLHSFLGALDASLGRKIIQTFALPCCCVVNMQLTSSVGERRKQINANNAFITHTSAASQLRHLPPGFFERCVAPSRCCVALLLRWSAGIWYGRSVGGFRTSEVGRPTDIATSRV